MEEVLAVNKKIYQPFNTIDHNMLKEVNILPLILLSQYLTGQMFPRD